MHFETLIVEVKDSIGIVTINRPDKMNALNAAVMDELKQVFTDLSSNELVSVVIITGNGQKAFVAGADISELNKLTYDNR